MNKNCVHFDPKKLSFPALLGDFKDITTGQKMSPNQRLIIRKGTYYRVSDRRKIARFYCRVCKLHFSRASFDEKFSQKKRHLNHLVFKVLVSGVSQRRAAMLLNLNRKTIVRKFRFLSAHHQKKHEVWLGNYLKRQGQLTHIQFDDLETSEHSKCKPLSVALAVDPKSRKILSFQVSQMPAKGHLHKIAIKRYGYRKDERAKGWDALFKNLKPLAVNSCEFYSDQNPHYPRFVKRHHPEAIHKTTKGRRGCVVGQGELKEGGFDPLFVLNHTCAMLRSNLNRLQRRTWCTTKKRSGLIDHLNLYVAYHNQVLTLKKVCDDEASAA